MARREPWERMSRHREISWLSSLAQGASPHSHFHASPQCQHTQTKDATVVCVIGCQITRTRIHTLPKRHASARHSRVRKLYSYQIHSARFKQTSQWRRKSWWCILPAALILWYAGSDVMGCRRPTGGVFSYVSSDRVTLRAFPVATPRGRSSSSHEGEMLLGQNSNRKLTYYFGGDNHLFKLTSD